MTKNKKIIRIEASCNKKCNQNCIKNFSWSRQTIGNIIENIPNLIKRDGFYKDIKIYYEK